MRIKRLELINFRTFGHLVLEDIPDVVVLVSPNGLGKSSILEAIIGAHELVAPYHRDDYQFREAWNQKHTPIWPRHLPAPVRLGQHRAEISMEVAPTDAEQQCLFGDVVEGRTGHAHFAIEDGRYISEQTVDDYTRRLFRYNPPESGVGFVDYIRPIRFYRHQPLGDFTQAFSENTTKQVFAEFARQPHEQEKFSTFKGFVAGLQLDDFSRHQETGEEFDSLQDLRRVFDMFFAPKQLLGYRRPTNGEPRIAVATPFGEHDVDFLSAGEKEVLHIVGHLFRFRDLGNIVLWDTPELHLNAALESRLLPALGQVAPQNQYWIATHSLELIGSTPLDNLYVIRPGEDGAVIEQASGEPQRTKIAIYQELGAQVGLQLVNACVVFCEGKEAHADKRHLQRLVGQRVPGVTFVAGGSCGTVLSAGSRAHDLLQQATANGDFLAVVDRDFRSDEQVAEIGERHGGRVFVWGVHEIENLLLDPQIIHHALVFHDQLEGLDSEEAVRASLDEAASRIAERIAAQWTAWQFSQAFPRAGNVAPADDPLGSLLKHAEALQPKLAELADPAAIKDAYQTRLDDVREIIAAGEACTRLPGKEILTSFLHEHTSLSREQFVPSAVTVVCEKGIAIGEIDRLTTTLRDAIGLKQE